MKRRERGSGRPPPDEPPPLTAMAERKARLEAERAELFPRWKAALEEHHGNVSRTSAAFFPELEAESARNRGNQITRRLGLSKWAADLRTAATGHPRGRQDR